MSYILYATTNYGDGYTSQVGRYDDIEEISIYINTFANDVVLSIEHDNEGVNY